MKKHLLLLFAAAGLCAGAIAVDQTSPESKTPPDPKITALEQQVATLQASVKTLEERLAKVESELPPKVPPGVLQFVPNNPAIQPPATGNPLGVIPGSGAVPKSWTPREFNGWTYYVVPCDAQGK